MNYVPKFFGAVILLSIPLPAQKKSVSRQEFQKQIAVLQSKEQGLREQIAQEQAVILDLKKRVEQTRERITRIRQQNLSLLGITESDVSVTLQNAQHLDKSIGSFLEKSDSEIVADTIQYFQCILQLQELRLSPASRLRKVGKILENIDINVAAADERLLKLRERIKTQDSITENVVAESIPETSSLIKDKPAVQNTYTVQDSAGKPETLYSIADKIYGDPFKWLLIYQANKAVIDSNFRRFQKGGGSLTITDPSDLIFPGQVLAIPQ